MSEARLPNCRADVYCVMFQCSVSCGSGVRQRSVECRNTSGDSSISCTGEKPAETKVSTVSCPV